MRLEHRRIPGAAPEAQPAFEVRVRWAFKVRAQRAFEVRVRWTFEVRS